MSKTPPRREFETQIDIVAPADAVWKAISDDAELCRWFAPEARIDATVGGEVMWRWSDHHTWMQRIEICEPGKRLRTRYESAVDDGQGGKQPLFIDFVLEGEGGMTTLRVTQSGFGAESAFDQEYDGISRGWPVELRSLRLYLEKHRGRDRQLAFATRQVTSSAEQVWKALTGPQGLACGEGVQDLKEGDAFRLQTPAGDLEGTALKCNAHELTGTVTSHGDAFLRISMDTCGGKTSVWLWLACYGQPGAKVDKMRQHFDDLLEKVFAGQAANAHGA